ncbi:MAG: tail fiber domain-containing protein [bacterium]
MNGGGGGGNAAQNALMQYALNRQAAADSQRMSMVSQTDPYGSLDYASDPNSPSGYRANITLSPEQKAILDQQNAERLGQGKLANSLLGTGFGALSGQPLKLGWSDTEARLNQINRNTLDPQWQQNQEQLDAQLYAKGVQPGSAAYDTAMRNFGQQKSDAYNNMYLQGHQTAVNDLTNEYNSPLNVLSALQSGSQVQTPNSSFVNTPQAQFNAPDYMGAMQQQQAQSQANRQAAMGGIFGLAGTVGRGLLGWSDRRLKKDIRKIGELENGLGVYMFKYLWSDALRTGLMADEVARVKPEAVHNVGGFFAVDYAKALGV